MLQLSISYKGESQRLVAPLLLYSDDLSGNHNKQWNLFDLRSIHLLCASNTTTAIDMMNVIVTDLHARKWG